MTRFLPVFSLLLLLGSGCTVHRSLAIGAPSPVHAGLTESERLSWRLGEVHVSVEGMSSNGMVASSQTGVDFTQYKQQLADRLKATLLAQEALGATRGAGAYALEVDVSAREVYGIGKQMWLSLLLEGLVMALGFGAGIAVDAATAQPGQVPSMTGFLVGGLGSIPVALGVATIPELAGCAGTFQAKLVLRRLSDRVPVSERRVESTWRADYNAYGVPAKLAAASGQAVLGLEQELLTAIVEMLKESQPVPASAP